MGVKIFLLPISVTLGQGHQATEAGQILLYPQDKMCNVYHSSNCNKI